MATSQFTTNVLSNSPTPSATPETQSVPVVHGIPQNILDFASNVINTANSSVQSMAAAGQWTVILVTIIFTILSVFLAIFAFIGYREIKRKVQSWADKAIADHNEKADQSLACIPSKIEEEIKKYFETEKFQKTIDAEMRTTIERALSSALFRSTPLTGSSEGTVPFAPQLPQVEGK